MMLCRQIEEGRAEALPFLRSIQFLKLALDLLTSTLSLDSFDSTVQ